MDLLVCFNSLLINHFLTCDFDVFTTTNCIEISCILLIWNYSCKLPCTCITEVHRHLFLVKVFFFYLTDGYIAITRIVRLGTIIPNGILFRVKVNYQNMICFNWSWCFLKQWLLTVNFFLLLYFKPLNIKITAFLFYQQIVGAKY